MPIYRYRCERCGQEKSEFHKMSETPDVLCTKPGCNSIMVKTVSRSSFSLKGDGWYKDGYS